MTQRLAALLSAAALLSGCNQFVTPRVACYGVNPTTRTANTVPDVPLRADIQLTAPRAGVGCAFPEVVDFTLTRAPEMDPQWAASNGNPSPNDLAYAPVVINRGSAAASLCKGVDCDPTQASVDTTLSSSGAMVYRVRLNLDALGVLVGPGGTAAAEGAALTEVYGPGNACPVNFKVTTGCAQALQTTTN
ncbi:MAG: hypothetical protein FJ086_05080 [Deltaproteobacteria bacterium]|nr:hypothetical protein [Deltaproteobacteria bacterium]